MVSESVRRFALLAAAPALLSKLHFNNVASGGFGNVGARFQHVQCVCGKRCGRSWAARNGGVGKRSVGLHFHVKYANSEEKRPSVTIDGRSQTACFLFLALLHSQGGCKQGACRYQQCGDCNDWCIAVTRMGGWLLLVYRRRQTYCSRWDRCPLLAWCLQRVQPFRYRRFRTS